MLLPMLRATPSTLEIRSQNSAFCLAEKNKTSDHLWISTITMPPKSLLLLLFLQFFCFSLSPFSLAQSSPGYQFSLMPLTLIFRFPLNNLEFLSYIGIGFNCIQRMWFLQVCRRLHHLWSSEDPQYVFFLWFFLIFFLLIQNPNYWMVFDVNSESIQI